MGAQNSLLWILLRPAKRGFVDLPLEIFLRRLELALQIRSLESACEDLNSAQVGNDKDEERLVGNLFVLFVV